MEIQTRTNDGALRFFQSVKEAFDYARTDSEVWKVSFNAEDGSRCRFVRVDGNIPGFESWAFQPILLPEDPRGQVIPPGRTEQVPRG